MKGGEGRKRRERGGGEEGDGMGGKEKEERVGGKGKGGEGKGRGCGGARKVVCPGARAGSRRACLYCLRSLCFSRCPNPNL